MVWESRGQRCGNHPLPASQQAEANFTGWLDLKNEVELLAAEIAGYRDRWRGTERLAEERLLMLLGVVAPALAATAVISTRPVTSGGSLSSDEGLALMWLAVAVVAEGLFIRLMHARLSI